MASPLDFARRTPLRRFLEEKSYGWRLLADAAIAVSSSQTRGSDDGLIVADLSPLFRLGFKGRGTLEAMKKRGIVLEPVPNRAYRQPDGSLCLVLGAGEVMLLGSIDGQEGRLGDFLNSWRIEDEERTYPLLRRDSHAWFRIQGSAAPMMLAKICGVDLRPQHFADLSIAQTSLAKLSAIIVREDGPNAPGYHVLADSSAALYVFECLLDAAGEFGGRVAGIESVQGARGNGEEVGRS